MDVKGPNLIKSRQFDGLRQLGNPSERAKQYYNEGIDEIIYLDVVASLYGRSNLMDIVEKTSQEIFIPITVGGGVTSVNEAVRLLERGADKIAINSAAMRRPELISEIANTIGEQSLVLSVEAKKKKDGVWEAYIESGREPTGRHVAEWVIQAQSLGVGEVFVTSIDKDGLCNGFDMELIESLDNIVEVPYIVGGGFGQLDHLEQLMPCCVPDGIVIGSSLHYEKINVSALEISNFESRN